MSKLNAVAGDKKKTQRATVIVEVDGGILLAMDHHGFYLLPGGKIDRGELPIAAAARELFEETRLRAYALELLFEHKSDANHHHVFRARANGEMKASDDAKTLAIFKGSVAESSLNLSYGTRDILKTLESHTTAASLI